MTRMRTHNEILAAAPPPVCLETAADVERWPEILPHYRDVRFLRRDGFGRGRVRMSAYRHFGSLPWPTWWVSEMVTDREARKVHYRHVGGITKGMRVEWRIDPAPRGEGSRLVIVHEWDGPRWPLVGGFAARRVIGPHFIHVIADRTLEGIRRDAERRVAAEGDAAESEGEGGAAADADAARPAAGMPSRRDVSGGSGTPTVGSGEGGHG